MNLVLIALDTLRADHMGCYGYYRDTTPFLDEFAQQSVLFENYFATTIPTHPSFTTVFTGRDAYGHQVTNVQGKNEPPLDIPVMAEILRDAGYQTLAVDTMGRWMSRGFQVYENPKYDFFGEPQTYQCGFGFPRRDKNFGAHVNKRSDEVLDKIDKSKPFFFFGHYWDPHQPYFPPAPYHRLYYQGNPLDARHKSMSRTWAFRAKHKWLEKWMEEQVTDAEYWVAQYDAEINYVDDQVKALFAMLQAKGLWEDTLVVVFSDHGEMMYEHSGEFDHEGLYDADVHVPLIMRFPNDARGGQRVSPMVANLDVLPTVLDVLGVKAPANLDGTSLVPLMDGKVDRVYSELFFGEGNWQCKRAVRTQEWKLIRALSDTPMHNWHGDPPKELFYLPDDPNEQTNLIHIYPRIAAELEKRLDGFLARMKQKYGYEDPILTNGPTFGKLGVDEGARQEEEKLANLK